MIALKNDPEVNASIKFIDACLQLLGDNIVLNRQQNRQREQTTTVPKKEILVILPFLGLQSNVITKQLKACINKFYGCIDLRVIFQSNHRIKSFFPYKDRFNPSQMSKVVYKASCWDCQDFYIGKQNVDYMTEKLNISKRSQVRVTHLLLLTRHFNWSQF